MENNISLISSAIEDTQNIIRAIDIKMQIAFGILVFPATNIGEIIDKSMSLLSSGSFISRSLAVIFLAIWLLTLYICLKCLSGIGNPIPHIKNDMKVSGIFYLGDQFKFGIPNCLINGNISSKDSINEIQKRLPSSEAEILNELTFEMMKLAYIRDLKLLRQRWVFRLTLFWAVLGIFIFAASANTPAS